MNPTSEALTIALPRAGKRGASSLDWLLGIIPAGGVALRTHDGLDLMIGCETGNERELLALACTEPVSPHGTVEIAPALRLEPAEPAGLTAFLGEHGAVLDHIGINVSSAAVTPARWHAFLEALGARVPAYRLDVGSTNDIVFALPEREAAEPAVVEFVHDRAARCSSVHFCVRVAADRARVERAFAAPHGGYKPGDEAFFRSVALPPTLALCAYVDLAFSDARIAPWPRIVREMGRRL